MKDWSIFLQVQWLDWSFLGVVSGDFVVKVVATQLFFMFTPNLEEMIQFDEHIFQMG